MALMVVQTTGPPHAMIQCMSTVSREELIGALRARSVTLVDVLSAESFSANHIPGAINLPVAEISRHAASVLPDRNAHIVTYCGGPT
jgi:rhodanese-related sulfurtransferase